MEAWSLFTQARAQPDSELARLAVDDADFKRLIDSIPGLHSRADGNLDAILPLDSDSLHALEQKFGHSQAASLGRSLQEDLAHLGYQTRALVFKDVSRIKSPRAHPIRFSEEQKRQIHATLRPGDILLSYTAGYVSSVFIPGQFKHGMTYVGDTAERAHAGLSSASLPEQAQAIASQFDKNLWTEVTADGRPADIIEAVAEGVKFSNLDHILDTHINRLLVLRPRLDDAERTAYLGGVFAYLGDPYDFTFDFADASRQVCTEVIYRAIQGLGGISLELTSRGGHPTLSADDLVLYHLNSQPSHFEFIFYAAEDPDHDDRRSRIWVGEGGQRRLKVLMLATE